MDLGLVLWAWFVTSLIMIGLWSYYYWYQRNAALADVGFCVGFGLVSIGLGFMTTGDVGHRVVVSAMGAVYAFRLGGYLFSRRVVNATEDPRYQAFRQKLGARAESWIVVYFIGQGVAIAIFSLPLLVLMSNPSASWSVWDVGGLVVWVLGVGGETLADYQLNHFRNQPHHSRQTCREGLWRYSRHPNYFFEGMHWCAYVIMGIGVPYGWLTLIGPILMIWALLKVSGIPFAEAQALASRGEDYRQYQQTTNAFIPWFPKKAKR